MPRGVYPRTKPATPKQKRHAVVVAIERGNWYAQWGDGVLDPDFDELHVPPVTFATALIDYPENYRYSPEVHARRKARMRERYHERKREKLGIPPPPPHASADIDWPPPKPPLPIRHYVPLPFQGVSAHHRDRFTLARSRFERLLLQQWWKHWRPLYSLTDFPRRKPIKGWEPTP